MQTFIHKEIKIYSYDVCHITKMAAMPKYGKTLKNLIPRNQWADFDKTLYETSETQVCSKIIVAVAVIVRHLCLLFERALLFCFHLLL